MERVLGVGGVFFRAADPAALFTWYREHLGVEPHFEHGTELSPGRTIWAIFRADTDYFAPSKATFMINYRVADLDAMLAQLRAFGDEVDARIVEDENGRFGWVMDPEGNRVELWQPPGAPAAQKPPAIALT